MSDRAFYGPADTYLENRQIVFAEDYERLERELAEAKALLQKACRELPVSYYPDNTPEKLAENIAGFVKDYTENYRELEKLIAWQEEAMVVFNTLDLQVTAASLGGGMGEDCAEVIAKRVPEVVAQLTAHKAALDKCHCALLYARPSQLRDEALSEIAKLKGNK